MDLFADIYTKSVQIPGVFDAIADWHKTHRISFANRDCALSSRMRYEEAAVIFHAAQTPGSTFCSFPLGRMDAAGCQNLTTLPADSSLAGQTNQLRAAAAAQQAAAPRQTFIYFYLRVGARALILSHEA